MKGMLRRALGVAAAAAMAVAGMGVLAGTADAAQVSSADIVLKLTGETTQDKLDSREFNAYRIGEYTDVKAEGAGAERVVTELGVKAVSAWDSASGSKLDAAIQAASDALGGEQGSTLLDEYHNSEYANDPASFIASLDTTGDGAELREIATALAEQAGSMTADVANDTTGDYMVRDAEAKTVTIHITDPTPGPGLYLVTDSDGAPILIGTPVPDPENDEFIDKVNSGSTLGQAYLKPDTTPAPTKEAINTTNTIVEFDGHSVAVGATVTYQVTSVISGSVGQGTDFKWVVKDKHGAGLTFGGITSVTVNGNDTKDYSVGTDSEDQNTTIVTINDMANRDGQQVVVTYTMTVNSTVLGAAAPADSLTNTAYVGHDADSTGYGDDVELHTYGFKFAKTNKDRKKMLSGAQFVVMLGRKYLKQDEDTKAWSSVEDQEDATLFTSGSNGVVSVQGLPAGTYTVKETKAPTDYMTPADLSFNVTINPEAEEPEGVVSAATDSGYVTDGTYDIDGSGDTTDDVVDFTVYNAKSIAELPMTGAAGTALFTVLGLLIAGAGVTVYMKSRSMRRMMRA